jgi:predicted permease
METLFQDIRFGFRMLLKSPSVTLVAILTLALGIGANTAIFSTLNGLFLRPLPVANADRLVVIGGQLKGVDGGGGGLSYLEYKDLREQTEGFSDLIAWNLNLVGLSFNNNPETAVVSYVSDNYFSGLGLKPAAGRLLYGPEVEKRGNQPEIVLSYGYWKKRFNLDPSVVGQQIKINGLSATVVGVAPETFHGLYSILDMQAYMPMGLRTRWSDNEDFWTKRDSRNLKIYGVLKPGVSLKQAQSSLNVVMQRMAQQFPEEKNFIARIYPERLSRPEPDPSNGIVVVGVVFMLLAGMVLLLACTNVANIILVRSTSRGREMAVRAALGAARIRLVRQLMTESVLLALSGGLCGIALGAWVSHLLSSIRIVALGSQLVFDFSMDWRVFSFGLAIALVTGVLVGIAPALRASRANLSNVLQEGSRGVVAGSARSRMRNTLVVVQVAASLMLLVVAGLFVRSAKNAEHAYLGFDPTHVLNATVDTRTMGFDRPKARRFYQELAERARNIPGVQATSMVSNVPMGYSSDASAVYFAGRATTSKDEVPVIRNNNVDTHYFQTMRIPLLRGRALTAQDNDKAPLVAIVNEFMAQKYWPNQDPIGKRFSTRGPEGPFIEVVGLSKQGKYGSPGEDPTAFFYLPMDQNPSLVATLQLRSSVPPETLGPQVEAALHQLAPGMPLFSMETMEQSLEGANGLLLYRMSTRFSGALGLVGLILAMVGVYGVISYAAAQRTHEIGVRMALGASRGAILKMILRQGLFLIGGGVIAGLILTFLAGRGLNSLLIGVSGSDPLTLAAASLLLAGVGFLASFIPARRAMNVEPLRALRFD